MLFRSDERYQATCQQLDSAKAENARLHQLATNIQANLEHYQQTMHQRQTEQTLAVEKQHAFYAQEITQLKTELTRQQNLVKPLEQDLAQRHQALLHLTKQHEQLMAEHAILKQQVQELDREKSMLLERESNAQKTIQEKECKSIQDAAKLNELEKKIAVLVDQHARLKQDLIHAQDKVETLRQEKLFLIQEKSQMEGYLKQIKQLED